MGGIGEDEGREEDWERKGGRKRRGERIWERKRKTGKEGEKSIV